MTSRATPAGGASAVTGDGVDLAWLRTLVRDVPDWPRMGITFRDITPLLGDPVAFKRCIDELADRFSGVEVDAVVGIESRGFILAGAIAYRLGASFVPVRKAGKLPWAVVREEYELEYGRDKLEIHRDAIRPDERVLVIDDVVATGGTALATANLVEQLGGSLVGIGALIEIAGQGGRAVFAGRRLELLATW